MNKQSHTGRVEQIKELTPTILSIKCQMETPLTFSAGQYVMLGFPSQTEDTTKDMPRWPMALASKPSEPLLEFCIRQQPDSPLQAYLEKLRLGSLIDIQGPFNNYTYDNPKNQRVVFIATGTAIAPFRSIIQSEKFQAQQPPATIILGAQTEAEIPYWEEWQQSSIEVIPVLSQAGSEWKGVCGWVTDYLQEAPSSWFAPDTQYYLCGQREMVLRAKELLQQQGVHAASIEPSY